TIGQFYVSMWPAPALAVALGLLVRRNFDALIAAAPVLVAWFVSPVVAFWVSRPRPTVERPLADVGRRALRRVARKTWLFFETFVGDDDHWLPPDNFQEEPDGRVAHRTSPTNQGLLLLSTLAAHDLGYIGLGHLVERLEKTFATFDRMERRRGHFYNWYETRTLRPLPPLYISTVDSGNLLGCLVALKQGLREKAAEPILGPQVGPGLADALGLAREALAGVRPAAGAVAEAHETFRALEEDLEALGRQLDERPGGLLGWDAYLERLDWGTTGGLGRIRALAGAGVRAPEDLGAWMQRLRDGVRERRAELDALAPWLAPLKALEGEAAAPWPSAEAAARWAELRGALVAPAGLAALAARAEDLAVGLTALAESCPAAAPRLRAMAAAVRHAAPAALLARTRTLAERAEALGAAMDFEFLYKSDRHLFTIGYNQTQDQLDEPSYDLLASESCLTSYLAVARGDAPRRHWFQLGRPFLRAAGRIGLISWGGTMFEYLMPRLLLRSLPGTLLDEAIRTAVARQVEYGRQKGVPWGISESAYSAQYADGDYQYQAFGVPGLGLKRGLDRDLVIAPYATALAVAVVPHEALENFRLLAAEGAEGPYGFYEAIDYTPTRMGPGGHPVVVRSYMAHHQGMSLVALANALLDDPMPRRFHAEPMVRSADLLLQERIPRDAPLVPASMVVEAHPPEAPAREDKPASMSRRVARDTLAPRTVLLSNARGYGVMLTNAGSGVSTCRGLDVTRWREDVTRDCWGQFIYVRDPAGGPIWSAGYQPTGRSPDPTEEGAEYEVTFSADKATFRRREGAIETVLDVVVAPESLAECRRVTLTNRGTQVRELELTSYAEVVLAPRDADAAHPAFGKLFLETEWLPGAGALLCRRRPRAADQKPVWAVHVSAAEGADVGPPRFETDRSRFLGRGRTPADPAALDPGAELSGTTGPVLDPILSLRRRVRLEPGTAAVVAFTTAVADSPAEARALADQYRDLGAVTRAFDLAYLSSQVEHHHRDWDPADLHQFQRLAAHVLYAGGGLRADPDVLAANQQGQPGLWRYGISGDRPIVLAHIAAPEALPLARQLLVAHQYLGLKGLRFDLLLLDEAPGEPEGLLPQLRALVRTAAGREPAGGPGGVFVLRAAQVPEADRLLLQAAARVVLVGGRDPLDWQLDHSELSWSLPEPLDVTGHPEPEERDRGPDRPDPDLRHFNGLGGFSPDGREYVLLLRDVAGVTVDPRSNGQLIPRAMSRPSLPPAPWINVVANPSCGFLVSEAGSGYTWAGNSQSNRLTPWNNDPVSDPPGEVLYLRDEDTGEVWNPTPLPIPSGAPAVVRHGPGYTTFEKADAGLEHELTLFVPAEDPIKLLLLTVRNPGDRPRRLSATFYAEWVLGTGRDRAPMQVITAVDPETGALLARNPFQGDFPAAVAFADVSLRPHTLTADRTEFLGRNGSVAAPAALGRVELSGRAGAALDPCAAVQAKFDLEPGQHAEIVFCLGQAAGLEEVRALLTRYRDPARARQALAEVQAGWDDRLDAVRVRTPNPAMDLLLNRWLLYQVLACRLWARSALYQSGGAFGFRDQLQDVMALVHAAPREARAQVLRAAARQFVEGDVQHWWHPPAGNGIRTRCSDDYIWLPFVAAYYATATGDAAVLDEVVPYLQGPSLRPGQEDDYGRPETADQSGTLYDHCLRALDRATGLLGAHGLPLMGTCDWNDGMNKVGAEGRGESVWLAWFLLTTLRRFADVAEARG
ncbi:MAG TPA: glucoamylase family protein, partial [Isosphaeraceae bacterium]